MTGVAHASRRVLRAIGEERVAQDRKWGEQNHEYGTGFRDSASIADHYRNKCQQAFAKGACGTWRDVLLEEVYEALAETEHDALATELVQVAAVCAAWVEAIRRRQALEAERAA